MRKTLLLILALALFTSFNAIGQKFKYWTALEVESSPDYAKGKIFIYKKRATNFTEIKLVNSSCFDVEYKFLINFKSTSKGASKAKIESEGILKKGESKTFYKSISNNIRFTELALYGETYYENGFSITPRETVFRTVSEDKWVNNQKTLKCLGFNSTESYLKDKKLRKEKREKEYAEMQRKKELKTKQLKAARLEKWIDKGIGYHLQHYSNKKKNSFFIDVPADSLEIFAKMQGKFLLVVNSFPAQYDLSKLNLNEDQKAFLENNFVAGLVREWIVRKKDPNKKPFIQWMQEKKIDGGVPIVLLFDPDGNIIYNKYTNTSDLPKIVPALMDAIFKQLPTID